MPVMKNQYNRLADDINSIRERLIQTLSCPYYQYLINLIIIIKFIIILIIFFIIFHLFFFNDLLLLYFTITVTVIIMKIVKLIYIYIIIRYWLYKYFLEFLKSKKRKSYELNKNISWSLLIKL